jgi:hypothetical protein
VIRFEASKFKVDKEKINVDLTKYIDLINNTFSVRVKNSINTQFKSIEDYVYILYWLRFEKQLGYSEIGKMLNPNCKNYHSNAYSHYLSLGLNYSINYSETESVFIEEQEKLKKLKEMSYNITVQDFNLTDSQYKEYYTLLENTKKLTSETPMKFLPNQYKKYGYNTLDDYFKALYFYVRICNLSTSQIHRILGITMGRIQEILRDMGLSVDIATSMKNAVKYNRRNYKNTLLTGRKTMSKYVIEKASYGSNIENAVRNEFVSYIAGIIGTERYEVIVGINNRIIIPPREIDIPVIVIDSQEDKIYKFAIEMNGDFAHIDNKKDLDKMDTLTMKGWKCYSIWQLNSTSKQKKYGTIKQQVFDICNDIKSVINV